METQYSDVYKRQMPVWDVKDQVDESKIDPLFKTIAEDAQNATGYIAWWDTFFEGSAAQDYLYACLLYTSFYDHP